MATKTQVSRLCKTKTTQFTIESLRPLIDLAYWSTFPEVKRDSAAAFAALTSYCILFFKSIFYLAKNIAILSRSGALGAILCLLNKKNDSTVHKDALIALSRLISLDEIKVRILNCPEKINSIFHLRNSPSVEVIRLFVSIICKTCELETIRNKLLEEGVADAIYDTLETRDEITSRLNTQIFKLLSENEVGKIKLCKKKYFDKISYVLMNSYDIMVKNNIFDYLVNISCNEKNILNLMKWNILNNYSSHLNLLKYPPTTIIKVLKGIEILIINNDIATTIVFDTKILKLLFHLLFVDIFCPETKITKLMPSYMGQTESINRLYRTNNNNNNSLISPINNNNKLISKSINYKSRKNSSNSLSNNNNYKSNSTLSTFISQNSSILTANISTIDNNISPRRRRNYVFTNDPNIQLIQNISLSIIILITSFNNLKDTLIENGLLSHLLSNKFVDYCNRKTKRQITKIVLNISENQGKPSSRHQDIVTSNGLKLLLYLLHSDINDFIEDGITIIYNMCSTAEVKIPLCNSLVIQKIIQLCPTQKNEYKYKISRILAEISMEPLNDQMLISNGIMDCLFTLIAPSQTDVKIKTESVRCLSILSSNDLIKPFISSSHGCIGYLLTLTRINNGVLKLYSNSILNNMKYETSAIKIQCIYRGYRGRKKYLEAKEALEQRRIKLFGVAAVKKFNENRRSFAKSVVRRPLIKEFNDSEIKRNESNSRFTPHPPSSSSTPASLASSSNQALLNTITLSKIE